jgi:hypothetical protein
MNITQNDSFKRKAMDPPILPPKKRKINVVERLNMCALILFHGDGAMCVYVRDYNFDLLEESCRILNRILVSNGSLSRFQTIVIDYISCGQSNVNDIRGKCISVKAIMQGENCVYGIANDPTSRIMERECMLDIQKKMRHTKKSVLRHLGMLPFDRFNSSIVQSIGLSKEQIRTAESVMNYIKPIDYDT